jgi:hypothetical protein
MGKIKKIYTFGSSYTAGGGFEFETDKVSEEFKNFYSSLKDEEFTQYNFSFPGQLQKLIENDITVYNKGKQGFGNHRTARLLYDIVNSNDFKKDETLFIIELTALGRDELFSKKLNKYFVVNYTINTENDFKYVGSATDYFYQTKDEKKYIESFDNFFEKYIKNFKEVQEEINKLNREIEFLISYLELNSINYILSSPHNSFNDTLKHPTFKLIQYGDGDYFKKLNCFIEFSNKNNLMIKHETNELSFDMHCGFKANKIVAMIIYNKLIDLNYINQSKIDINWSELKNNKFYNI